MLTYIIRGEAPILVGRPLLEKLGLAVDYQNKMMKWPDGNWEEMPTGAKGEHLLHLGADVAKCLGQEPHMVLIPDDSESHIGDPIAQHIQKLLEEDVMFTGALDAPSPSDAASTAHTHTHLGGGDGVENVGKVKRLHGHVLRKLERQAEESCRQHEQVLKVSNQINKTTKNRVVWEVFVGNGLTTKHLQKYRLKCSRCRRVGIFTLLHIGWHSCRGFAMSNQMNCCSPLCVDCGLRCKN